jgi:hypothetical protein
MSAVRNGVEVHRQAAALPASLFVASAIDVLNTSGSVGESSFFRIFAPY